MTTQYSIGLLCVFALTACQPASHSQQTTATDTSSDEIELFESNFNPNFREYFRTLASDQFMGRAPATKGEEITVAYIEQQFKSFGLKPANQGSYRQPVPVTQIDPVQVSSLRFAGNNAPADYVYRQDMMAWSSQMLNEINVEASDIVFVGYGIVAPEYNWNDYEGLDVTGKTVVMFVNDPGYATQNPELFNGNAMTYYGRWTYKYEEAARQGAAMALIVHETAPASYGWHVVAGTSPIRFELANENKNMHRAKVEGWLSQQGAERLFAAAGLDLEALRQQALSGSFQPIPLEIQASINIKNNLRTLQSDNVIGYIEGSTYPEETVIYMAHWDHFGMDFSLPDNQVFNGAQDNAGGVAALLAIAERMAQEPAPQRSVVFMSWAVEERGLLGSAWYAANPLFPLETTVAGVNMDVINVHGPMKDVMVVGHNSSELEPMLEHYSKLQHRYIVPEPTPEDGFYYRSDHFSLAKVGVPMLYARGGIDHIEHGKAWGLEQRHIYNSQHYHKVTDEFDENWDLRGAAQDMYLFYHIGNDLANSRQWPNWYQGNEFRAIRDASARVRQ
ncbi:M28 family metallopeptidase [Alkalimonas mucilaginosa]|uniref:M28 family metallopeptidase n=1 Tax=Alkalimonas mucilaginosa TaxID=3057676 RepID=A0ABU7JDM5_9GAMM|nr:M28 family metallopeptidase [Alkalimonas sp. MEB004]MEE2023787.1 M28 family metallopeptidase [Alkalimonas sp. MEB004]